MLSEMIAFITGVLTGMIPFILRHHLALERLMDPTRLQAEAHDELDPNLLLAQLDLARAALRKIIVTSHTFVLTHQAHESVSDTIGEIRAVARDALASIGEE
jgi:hypothetical protein